MRKWLNDKVGIDHLYWSFMSGIAAASLGLFMFGFCFLWNWFFHDTTLFEKILISVSVGVCAFIYSVFKSIKYKKNEKGTV